MRRTCPTCGKLVDYHHKHESKRKRKWYKRKPTEQSKLRSTAEWQRKRDEIKARDHGVDQVAAHGLDGSPYIETRCLQVHHIEPIEERPDLAFDNANLITVSSRTHELCERGEVPREALHTIAKNNNKRYFGS